MIHQVIALYQAGRSGSQIKAELGVPPTTLFRALRKLGIKPRSEYISDVVKSAALRDYEDGVSTDIILSKHKIRKTSFYRWLRSSGVSQRPPRRKFTRQDIDAINAAYAAGESISSLVGRFKTTYNTLGPLIRNKRTASESARRYTSQQIDGIINDYANGDDIKTICERHGCHRFTVKSLIKKRMVTIRRQSKYDCNDLFFSELDSESKLYWFGFLLADGHVHTPKNGGKYVEVNLGMKDKTHLELFKRHVGYTGPLKVVTVHHTRTSKTYQHVNLRIKRTRLVDDLNRHGLSLLKAGDATPLSRLNDGQMRHIIRGFFDGDGSIYMMRGSLAWHLSDNHREIIEYFMSRCPVVARHNASGQAQKWRVSYGGNRIVPAICNWLYADTTIYLARKRQIYDNFIRLMAG